MQQRAGAQRITINGIIGAHQRIGLAVDNGRAESGQVGVFEVEFGDIDIEAVTQRFRTGMDGEVLRRRHALVIERIVALDAMNEADGHVAGQVRVLAIGFLTAAPARIAEDVDIGRPVVDTVIAVGAGRVARDGGIIIGAAFGGDGVADCAHQGLIPGGGQTDGLRIDGGVTGAGHAVQHFVPPAIAWQAEARNGRGIVLHLRRFFFQRHA